MLGLLLLFGCTASPAPEPPAPAERRVLVVGWDGVRADTVEAVPTPNLDRVGAWGGLSFDASTQLTGPTSSGPGWMSIMTGVEPEEHGVVANGEYDDRDARWPTFFAVAHDAGFRTFAAVHWPEILVEILEPEAVDESALSTDAGVAEAIIEDAIEEDHAVIFGHFDDPDHAGHGTGYSTENPDYVDAITSSDALLGELLDAIQDTDQEWLVMVTTDHGGEGTDHGPMEPVYQQIFLGAGVVGGDGGWDMDGASHMDVYATVLSFLGLSADADDAFPPLRSLPPSALHGDRPR